MAKMNIVDTDQDLHVKDLWYKGLMNILVGQCMYRARQGYIQDTLLQDTFWTRTELVQDKN